MDLLWSNQGASSNIEPITYAVSTTVGIIKNLCIFASQKKLGININAAIDDWLSAKDEETKEIMKKYAIKAKILNFSLLYSLFMCVGAYISVVMFINLKQMNANLVDGKIRLYLLCAVIFVNLIFNLNYCNIILMFFFLFLCCVVNTTNWVFLIPSGPLVSSITVSQYAIILIIQIVQVFALSLLLCIADSLFFNVTIHLTGQLEVLKNKFKI